MDIKTKKDFYLEFIQAIFDNCKLNGSFKSMVSLYDSFPVAKNFTGIALQRLEIIEQIGKGVYGWKSTAVPNLSMASEVIIEVSKLQNKANKNHKDSKNSENVSDRHLTSISDLKEKWLDSYLAANAAASILGVDLSKVNKEKAKKFIKEFEK